MDKQDLWDVQKTMEKMPDYSVLLPLMEVQQFRLMQLKIAEL